MIKKQWLLIIPVFLVTLATGGYYYYQQQTPYRPVMQECLGRLTFDVPDGLHWGILRRPTLFMMFRAYISEGLSTDFDKWSYNNQFLAMVSPETEKKYFTDQWTRFQPGDYHKQQADEKIQQMDRMLASHIKEQQEQKAQHYRLPNGEKMHEGWIITDQAIEHRRKMLEKAKQERAELDLPVPVHLLSIPDAYTVSFDTQWAFAWRQNRVYLFYFSNRLKKNYNTKTDGVPLADVNNTLQHFSPRKLGEIPKAPAFCYPYGSIADTGKEGYEIKNSFYFKDQPNIIYSIYTGTYREAFMPKSVANYGLREPIINYGKQNNNYTHQTISQTYTLGTGEKITLTGQLSTRKEKDGKDEPYDYVFTGQTQGDNPFIGIQIVALDQDPTDGRPNHAPPLKETLKRLKPILNSMQITLDKP